MQLVAMKPRSKRVYTEDRRVLCEMSRIPDAALQRWLMRCFATVVPLAHAELARRKAAEKRRARHAAKHR